MTASSEIAHTSPTGIKSNPADTAASGTSPAGEPRHPKCSFGMHLESMAAYFRLAPADTALAVASLLSDIAGPLAGFVDENGRRFPVGISVLRVDDDKSPRRCLEAALMQPIQDRSDYLRIRSQQIPRELVERAEFGAAHMNKSEFERLQSMHPWLGEVDQQRQRLQEQLMRCPELSHDTFDDLGMTKMICMNIGQDSAWLKTSFGPNFLPSFYVERVGLDGLHQVLNECIHRKVLVRDPHGGIFGRGEATLSKVDKQGAGLVALMRGTDLACKPVNVLQGAGTFEHSRVHIWAGTTLLKAGEVLADTASSWNDVIGSCLIWNPTASEAPLEAVHSASDAMRLYHQRVTQLLNDRLYGAHHEQCRKTLHPSLEAAYQRLRRSYADLMDKVDSLDAGFVMEFHDLPERLLWAFMLLHEEKEAFWPLQAAFRAAVYAVRTKQHFLKQARRLKQEEELRRSSEVVCAILGRKGPCGMREMQRSSNNLRVSFLRPGVEMLERQGRLRLLPDNRYELLHAGNPRNVVQEGNAN